MGFYRIFSYLLEMVGKMFPKKREDPIHIGVLPEDSPVVDIQVSSLQDEVILNEDIMNTNKLIGVLPQSVMEEIPSVMEKFGINTPLRLAHFLSQCSHESGHFKSLSENLNYSVDGLKKIFGKYFKPAGLAESYARKPEKIASRVYADRMGNGAESTGDGWKYRGRGAVQLTGKNNYTEFSKFVPDDVVSKPDLVATKYALTSAAWFFKRAGLNEVADRGSSEAVITAVTKKINGGTNGLPDRIKEFKKFYALLNQPTA